MILTRSLSLMITAVSGGLTLSSTLLLLHPGDLRLLTVTAQLTLLLVELGVLWLLRPRPSPVRIPLPPWETAAQELSGNQRRVAQQTRRTLRWRLARLRLRAALASSPPMVPARRPARSARPRRQMPFTGTPSVRQPRRRRRRIRLPVFALPWPTVDIEFVAAGARPVRQVNTARSQEGLLAAAEAVLTTVSPEAGPPILALQDHPRQLTLQLASSPLLSAAQQREVVEAMRARGLDPRWTDVTTLAVRREALHMLAQAPTPPVPLLWVPVLNSRQTTVWWPLPRHQHLVLAGHVQAPLAGLLRRLPQLPDALRPQVLIHDPDGRLRELGELTDLRPAQADALAEARRLQLQHRFTRERQPADSQPIAPLLILVEPTAALWAEVQPLIEPDSGVQTALVLGHQPSFAPLRALCHRLPVIEIASGPTPPLAETFRPASLPAPRPGQALAWMHGGSVWWRGRAPEVTDGDAAV